MASSLVVSVLTMKKLFLVLGLIFFSLLAHSGRTNSLGCHNDKRKKINAYHCHWEIEAEKIEEKKSEKYNRRNWRHWIDEDGDCQNLRNELLIATSKVVVEFKTTKKCQVAKGEWWGPYSTKYFTSADEVDIDHVVPLKEAWLSGGKNWIKAEKKIFANDPDNLLVVHKKLNRSKGAKDIARWLPPNEDFICQYLAIWQLIKSRYQLEYDEKELLAISQLQKDCQK